jgi:hypothetical protein
MSTRFVYPVGRREPFRFKQRSITAKRAAYMKAGEPYGHNRKGLKRWLREVKRGDYYDERDAWLCVCGNFITDGLHCSACHAEPPWGCPCSRCQGERYADESEDDGYYFDPYEALP